MLSETSSSVRPSIDRGTVWPCRASGQYFGALHVATTVPGERLLSPLDQSDATQKVVPMGGIAPSSLICIDVRPFCSSRSFIGPPGR